jgi:hypothetical protein
MQNLGNVYICGPHAFVMSRTDAHNGLDMVLKFLVCYFRLYTYSNFTYSNITASYITK